MPPRDSRGRFKKGCTHSRNYVTKRCRSKREHDLSLQRLRTRRRSRALSRIGRAVSRKRRGAYDRHGVARGGYDAFVP